MRHFDIRKMKRRQFLQLLGEHHGAPLMSQFSELAYGAGPFNDYRALVCVFLFGGNDAHNMIVPLDSRYRDVRRQSRSAGHAAVEPAGQRRDRPGPGQLRPASADDADQGAVQPAASSRSCPTSASCCARPPRPTTTARNQLPPQLFSHSDMQDHWQTLLSASAGQRRLGRTPRRPDPERQHRATVGVGLHRQFRRVSQGQFGGRAPDRNLQRGRTPNTPIVQRIRAWRDWDTGANGAQPQTVYQNASRWRAPMRSRTSSATSPRARW